MRSSARHFAAACHRRSSFAFRTPISSLPEDCVRAVATPGSRAAKSDASARSTATPSHFCELTHRSRSTSPLALFSDSTPCRPPRPRQLESLLARWLTRNLGHRRNLVVSWRQVRHAVEPSSFPVTVAVLPLPMLRMERCALGTRNPGVAPYLAGESSRNRLRKDRG